MDLDAGRLVAVNVRVVDASRLDDPYYVEQFFRKLIQRIGMQPLTVPMSLVVPADESNVNESYADDGGMTTQCVISTSHVAYHSWPLQKRFRLVVDSCKDFGAETVTDTIREWFAVNGISTQDIRYEAPEEPYAEAQTQAQAPYGIAEAPT